MLLLIIHISNFNIVIFYFFFLSLSPPKGRIFNS